MMTDKALDLFHPVVAKWFTELFQQPTPAQAQAWPCIKAGKDTLIAAPTGSGKTLAAFFSAIDDLVRQSVDAALEDKVQVVYISPLKALSNDIRRNLEVPLKGIRDRLDSAGLPKSFIRASVRTGDTTQSERTAMKKNPPHILVTTPESLYLLLTSDGGRKMLSHVRTVIVDEIHALVGDKRGTHLSLTLERLAALVPHSLQRIGLSATQKPIETVARFLVGNDRVDAQGHPDCEIIDTGHQRALDLDIDLPGSPLSAVMANDVWEEIYEILERHILSHQTTLIFVNTRRLAERLSHNLKQRLGKETISAHHGSLSKEQRFDAEQKLKGGNLRALVATASMELGIDIGSVDLVCQIASPKSIAAFLQRVGRSGHFVGGTPKGRMFPLTRDDLVECTAILDAVRRGELDRIVMPEKPLDILAQQIVAEVACEEYQEDDLYRIVRNAYPYRELGREEFDETVQMLSEGFSLRRGRRGAYLHYDAVNGRLRGRKGARLNALLNGGAIPDTFNYDVVMQPSGTFVGNLDEDFAIESMAGDIFQLGNGTWRIQKVETGKVFVEDANGQAPTIPFWFGEAPGRTNELSEAVARLRKEIGDRVEDPRLYIEPREDGSPGVAESVVELWAGEAMRWLQEDVGISEVAAEQLVLYLGAVKMALGEMPTQDTIVMERFFDEGGDMHLVVHAPFGSRLNRGWGLALRKRFCRNFNFELQAAATEDAIVLSLGATHSFPLEEVFDYLQPHSVREVLVQALLDAPMFGVRWRWNASRALAVLRRRGGNRVAPTLQRMDAEDLISLVFPDQLACLEHIAGDREVPDHPLVRQTIEDCLTEAMDIEQLEALVTRITQGKLTLIGKDLREASPLAQEIINAKPYAFLDPAGLEERRTHAIKNRRWLDPAEAAELGKLDFRAIERVRAEAWPQVRSADELHEALNLLGYLTAEEGQVGDGEHSWQPYFEDLQGQKRAAVLIRGAAEPLLWIAAERLPEFEALFSDFELAPKIEFPARLTRKEYEDHDARRELLRGRLEVSGPTTEAALAASLGIKPEAAGWALMALEAQGFVFRGRFTPDAPTEEWCERRLLARIHRYTISTLRKEIQAVSPEVYMRFLLAWQRVGPEDNPEGPEALQDILSQLEGYEAPAAAWEAEIIPTRMADYDPLWLDVLCMSGRISWGRFRPPQFSGDGPRKPGPIRTSPITLLDRAHTDMWKAAAGLHEFEEMMLSHEARKVHDWLKENGARFFEDIVRGVRLLRSQVETALGELVTYGMLTSDSYTGLRALLTPTDMRPKLQGRSRPNSRGRRAIYGMEQAGRWSLLEFDPEAEAELGDEDLEEIARVMLRRYGVVFRKLVERERNVPPWRVMVRVFRRLEARGDIRGGRFVDGLWGEQYALPEAIGKLRKLRNAPKEGVLTAVSAVDPLNMLGILTTGNRLAALAGNRVLFRDGEAIAVLEGKEVKFLVEVEPSEKWELQKALVKRVVPVKLRAYLGKSVG
ncbi:MAG: DEAD/DEAH box helicase [Bacteroidota bacterium]